MNLTTYILSCSFSCFTNGEAEGVATALACNRASLTDIVKPAGHLKEMSG